MAREPHRRDHPVYRAAPRRAPPERHAASARRRSHNSFVRPPRFIGVLTVIAAGWISLNLLSRAWLSPYRSASLLRAGRRGLAGVAHDFPPLPRRETGAR